MPILMMLRTSWAVIGREIAFKGHVGIRERWGLHLLTHQTPMRGTRGTRKRKQQAEISARPQGIHPRIKSPGPCLHLCFYLWSIPQLLLPWIKTHPALQRLFWESWVGAGFHLLLFILFYFILFYSILFYLFYFIFSHLPRLPWLQGRDAPLLPTLIHPGKNQCISFPCYFSMWFMATSPPEKHNSHSTITPNLNSSAGTVFSPKPPQESPV